MGQNVYSSAVFAGGRPLYLERVVPINHSWHQKTRDTGLPKVKTASPSAFPRFDTIPECDGRTDGRTDGPTDLLQHIQRLLSDVSSIYLFFIQTLISEWQTVDNARTQEDELLTQWRANLLHRYWRPIAVWMADTVNDFGYADRRQKMHSSSVQPRQDQPDVEHPAAVVLAVMDWMNNLPVAIKRVDNHACRSSVQPNCNQSCTIHQEAQSHCSRTRVFVVVKHSRCSHCKFRCGRHASKELKGRMSRVEPQRSRKWQ